mmetsp:Transcript_16983/g.12156  ORF Transcript_16983/g.12156 Transcript_16983/m.12156 type:complete len:87 (+) Transcript_16983:83-343(+)
MLQVEDIKERIVEVVACKNIVGLYIAATLLVQHTVSFNAVSNPMVEVGSKVAEEVLNLALDMKERIRQKVDSSDTKEEAGTLKIVD